MPEILTVQELAKYLKMHPETIKKAAKAGRIPGWRVSKCWRFDKDVIDKMFKLTVKQAPRYDEVYHEGVKWLDKLGEED